MEWIETVSKSNKLMPGDVDLYILSQLLQINILILHRSKYGKKEGGTRGDVEDQSLSSSFMFPQMKDWDSRPFFMVYKDTTDESATYSPIVSTDAELFLHPSVKEYAKKDIKELLNYHVSNATERFAYGM